MGERSGHGSPNAARATDGISVRPLSTSGKNPGGIFERVPEKICLAPCPKLPAEILSNTKIIKKNNVNENKISRNFCQNLLDFLRILL